MPKNIVVADDNGFIRRAVCEAFSREADLRVCAEAGNGEEAIQTVQRLRPDLVVLNLSMPVMNGLDAARRLKKLMPSVLIIMFTLFVDPFLEDAAHSAGIAAVVSKSEPISVLTRTARGLLYRDAA